MSVLSSEIVWVAIVIIVLVVVINDSISFSFLWEVSFLFFVVTGIVPRTVFIHWLFMPSVRPFRMTLFLHGCWQESLHHFLVSFVFFNLLLIFLFVLVQNLLS